VLHRGAFITFYKPKSTGFIWHQVKTIKADTVRTPIYITPSTVNCCGDYLLYLRQPVSFVNFLSDMLLELITRPHITINLFTTIFILFLNRVIGQVCELVGEVWAIVLATKSHIPVIVHVNP
jgi:hypothetical protein